MPRSKKHRRVHRIDRAASLAVRRLFAETLESRVLLTAVTGVNPPANSHSASPSANISATFDQNINADTATPENFVVHSSMRPGGVTISTTGDSVTANPTSEFFPGELVEVTATPELQSAGADPVAPHVWQFRAAVASGGGVFGDSGQTLGDHQSVAVSLGDLDGDGDLDSVVMNLDAIRIWLNSGDGTFSYSTQFLGSGGRHAALGDLDGDGDLDVFTDDGNVLLNDGSAVFREARYRVPTLSTEGVALGDLDGDGDLDVFTAVSRTDSSRRGNRVWLNNPSGYGGDGVEFIDSEQSLGDHNSNRVAIGDLDGDGDLDAFTANGWLSGREANRIWLNDGSGEFSDSGQELGDADSFGVSLGDLDGDGDLDALVSNSCVNVDRVWLNDGAGAFSDSGQVLANPCSYEIALGDLDGDGDLDAFAANADENHIWLNNGSAEFSDTGQDLGNHLSYGVALGDLDGDGDLDTFSANYAISSGEANRVWLNQTPPNAITLIVDNPTIAEAGGVATISAASSTPADSPITISLALSGTASAGGDYTTSALEVVIAAGDTTNSVSITAVDDTLDEPDETVIVEISAVTGAVEAGEQQVTVTIQDDDEPQPASFRVTSFDLTASGFTAAFSHPLDHSVLNLYDTQSAALGAADITLVGATVGAVNGSLTVDAASNRVTFIKTGAALAADDYIASLRSAPDGFKDTSGALLDGDGDGTSGDDYTMAFTISNNPDAVSVSIPDFVRGPGQNVNLPADVTTGIPLAISNGASVRAIDVQLAYDPTLLDVTAADVGPGLPPGATVVLNDTTPGVAILEFRSPSPLAAGSATVVSLTATVPAVDAGGIYRRLQIVDLRGVSVRDGDENELSVIEDDSVHLATFFADVSGNGRVNAADASQVARVAALLDSGFASSPVTDPLIVADVTGNARINAADASRLAQFAALIDVPQIPPIPPGIVIAGAGRSRGVRIQFPPEPNARPAVDQDSRLPPFSADAADAAKPFCYACDTVMKDPVDAAFDGSTDDEEWSLVLQDAVEGLLSAFAGGW